MKDIIISAVLMVACYFMFCLGIVYHVEHYRMIIGAFALMGSSFTAGLIFATERFRNMLSGLLDEMEAERNGEE